VRRPARHWRGALVALALPVAAAPARAQEWRAAAQVGRASYEGAPAAAASTSTLVLGLGRSDLSSWLGLSAGIPMKDAPWWGVAAARRRFEEGVRLGALLDLSGHAFLQRDLRRTEAQPAPTSPLDPLLPPPTPPPEPPPPLSGQGAGGEAAAGGFATLGPVRLETRLGAAAQASEVAGVGQRRLLPLAHVRLSLEELPLSVSAETRGWSAHEGDHVYAGVTAQLARGPIVLWGSSGRWVEGGTGAIPWTAGASLALGDRLTLEVSARGNAFDPLYRTETALSVVAGTTVRLGGRARRVPERAPVPDAYEAGRALVRLRSADASGSPAIAGDFTDWKPRPMRRDGDGWVFAVALDPGVYHYAFVAEDGKWFVPDAVPGRQSDGMGGFVAVLVVSP
jgi:hypothetical protein